MIAHGVVRADDPRPAPIDAFDAGAVVFVRAGDLAVAASRLPATIDETRLFEEPADVERLARAHNRVLVDIAEKIDVAPIRLGAVHSGVDALFDFLDAERAAFEGALRAVAGAVEYAVDIASNGPQPDEPAAPSESVAPVSGRDYLRARGLRRNAARDAAAAFDAFVDEAAERLSAHARKCLVETTAAASASVKVLGARAPSASFLAALDEISQGAAANGYEFSVTGPWPAYSFVNGDA
ncbi:MAG: GvpL/GvpF family gas vesicle protein [Parvularculaceae bacterium]